MLASMGRQVVTRERAEEYRRLAREALATAQTVASDEARNSLIAMAQVWSRLADEQETMPLPPGAANESQPAIQQQQQVQPKKDDDKE